MWNLFDWFSSSDKKAQRDQLSALPTIRRTGSQPADLTSPAAVASTAGERGTSGDGMPTLDSVLADSDSRERAHQAHLRSDLDGRKDSMAYWRMNTNRQRPTDSHSADYLANSGQSWNPFSVDNNAAHAKTRFTATTNLDLSQLGPLLSSNNRNYFSNSYAMRAQAKVDARSSLKSSQPAPSIENYPHYQGAWEPAKLEDFEAQPQQTLMPAETEQDALLQPQFLSDTEEEQATTLDRMPATQVLDVCIAAADNPATPRDTLLLLAQDLNPDVRFAIAENHNADKEILQLLAGDENPFVASRAKKTLKRLEGGQFKQGNFGAKPNIERVRKIAN